MPTDYRQLLARTLSSAAAPSPTDSPPGTLAVERGVAWPLLMETSAAKAALDLLAPLLDDGCDPEGVEILDRAGHQRSVYRGLLAYSAAQAIRSSDRVLLNRQAGKFSQWMETIQEDVQADLTKLGKEALPAAAGDRVAAVAWGGLALLVGGELFHDDGMVRNARATIHALIRRQQPTGPFLLAGRSDNPEAHWFHELQILHAIASFGMQSGDNIALSACRVAADFHLNETQPDHATNQPWGLPAFLLQEQTYVMADGLLHAARIEQPSGLDGVTLILLADGLYSLRRWKRQ